MIVYRLFAAKLFQFCPLGVKVHQLKAESVLETNHLKANVEIPCFCRTPKVHYIVHEDAQPDLILSQSNQVYAQEFLFPKIQLSII
jgi:hypothetical protein